MIDELIEQIEELGRFESLVQLPLKRDPDWPKWAARGTKGEHGTTTNGDTAQEALEKLVEILKDAGA